MSGRVVLVTAAGDASGSKAAAAALACAGSDVDRPGLLIDVGGRPPRPTLIASAGARELEERLTVHLPQFQAASRGQTCHLAVPDEEGALELVRSALPLARDSVAAVFLPSVRLQPVLAAEDLQPTGAILRADLASERALTALAVADLLGRGLRVKVLKRPLAWVSARRALFGVLPAGTPGGLPSSVVDSLLGSEISPAHACYSELDDPEADPEGVAQRQRRGDEGPGRWGGFHRDAQRQAGR